MRVRVYFNLHRHVWSVMAMEGPERGRVVGHTGSVLLKDVSCRVSQAGRRRVLHEQRKNVHAFLDGILVGVDTKALASKLGVHAMTDPEDSDLASTDLISYNPYRNPEFFLVDDPTKAVMGAKATYASPDRKVYALHPEIQAMPLAA